MFTPFDVRKELLSIRAEHERETAKLGHQLADARQREMISELRAKVLHEVAVGSPDARTLARTVLEW